MRKIESYFLGSLIFSLKNDLYYMSNQHLKVFFYEVMKVKAYVFTYGNLILLVMPKPSFTFFIKSCRSSHCLRDKANKQIHKLVYFN